MTLLSTTDTPRPTTRTDDWQVGEIVTTADGGRWKIHDIDPHSGDVSLAVTNRVASGIAWETHLDNLPEKNA